MNKDKKFIILITILFVTFSIFLWGKTGNMLIDFSRESYIPYQLLNKQVLIKDIFLIYGAFGYLINVLIYKINVNVNWLILLAHIISYLITLAFFFIIKKFENNKIALIFTTFFIATSVFSHSTFGFALPYSYSTLWGILGTYYALFSLIYNKKILLFLSLGLIAVNKIELFIPVFIISLTYLIIKKEKFKKELLYISIFPLITLIYLMFSNISIQDITKNYHYLKNMLNSNALEYLYKGMGSFFNIDYFKYNCLNFLKFTAICSLSYILHKNKIISFGILLIGFIFINTNESLNLIGLISIIIAGLLIFKKKLNKEDILLFGFAIILCSKSFFAINSLSYSNFGYCLIIFCLFIFLKKILNQNWVKYAFIIFFIINYIGNLGYIIINPKDNTKTNIGKIWLDKYETQLFQEVNGYLERNVKNDENFLVLPEGQIFNLIHKKPYKYYNSTFTPLDFEIFGEKKLLDEIAKNNHDYMVFFPRNTSDYGANTICIDYGIAFCKFIIDNYTKTYVTGEYYKAYIYKRKNK